MVGTRYLSPPRGRQGGTWRNLIKSGRAKRGVPAGRHSARQMQNAYGMNFAASILFGGDKSQLETIISDIASGLASLQFSRSDEYQADEYSIRFLSGTSYYPKGIAGFFEKLNAEDKTNDSWEILSTHPSDENRLEHIEEIWTSLGSPTGELYESEYTHFKTWLP